MLGRQLGAGDPHPTLRISCSHLFCRIQTHQTQIEVEAGSAFTANPSES